MKRVAIHTLGCRANQYDSNRLASRSREIPEVLEEIRELEKAGVREAVLTGIHIGSYGRDLKPRQTLFDLMLALEKVGPALRIRLSTLDPDEVSGEILSMIAGNDFKIPDVSLGADVIAGFPSETREDHQATRELLESLPLAYLHVFPYSERKGTSAADFPLQVPAGLRRERALEVMEVGWRKKRLFWESQIGKVRACVAEEGREGPLRRATTDNFIPVWTDDGGESAGSLVFAQLEEADEGRVLGKCRYPQMKKSA